MRRKLQYPSLSSVINVPVPYPVVPGGDFPKFDLVLKPKPIQLGSFNNLVVIPTPYPVVSGGDFSQFNLVQKPKPTQLGSFTNTVYLPAAAVAFQPYVFSQFEQPQPRKGFTYSFDDGWTGTGTPVQNFVFTTFSQPQGVRSQQEQGTQFQVLPPTPVVVQPYVFTAFGQPQPSKPFQENVFNGYEATQLFFQPVFSTFEQPRFKQVRQDLDNQFTIFPITQVVSTPVFTGFTDFGIPVTRRIQQPDVSGTLQQQIVTAVQPYVFSQFNQPQFKKQTNDQPTWFGSAIVSQPYVFSAFSQPQPVRFRADTQYVQTSFYPILVVPPPNFTGFNDFGLAQQLLGTQQKQDGGYVQFTVLPMPQVISPYFFTGFSDFATMLLTKQTGLVGRNTDQPNVVLQPIIPPPFPSIGPGGTKRWKEGYEQLRQGTAPLPIPIVSSNLSSVVYDEDSKELTVEFKTYKYEKVPAKKVRGLLSAGGYFQQNIKGKYPTTRIK